MSDLEEILRGMACKLAKDLETEFNRHFRDTGPEEFPDMHCIDLEKYLRESGLLRLLEAGQAHFAKHYECEDNFYGCPKSEGYFGTDAGCTCGKDEWDAAKAAMKGKP